MSALIGRVIISGLVLGSSPLTPHFSSFIHLQLFIPASIFINRSSKRRNLPVSAAKLLA